MNMLTDVQVDQKIAALESQVTKQQAEINQLITINEEVTKTLSKMAAVLETISAISAGSDDGL